MNNTIVIGIILTLICVTIVNVENVNAQQNNNNNTTRTTGITNLNFSKILAGKAFKTCELMGIRCVPIVDLLYQDKKILVLKSSDINIIWKAVGLARANGYKIDGISNYEADSDIGGGRKINILVVMSK